MIYINSPIFIHNILSITGAKRTIIEILEEAYLFYVHNISYFFLLFVKRRYVKYEAAYLVRLNRLCINEQKFPTPSSWRKKSHGFIKSVPDFVLIRSRKRPRGKKRQNGVKEIMK